MPDYAGQANSIYDPQLQGEQAILGASNTATQAAFSTDTNNANSAYADALKSAGSDRDTAASHNDFVAQSHGLWSSGLAANAQRLTYQNYVDNASKIGEQRAQKLTDIGNRQTAATQSYQAHVGALSSRYAGLKSQYITGHQDADSKAAAANAAHIQAAEIAAQSRKGKGVSASDRQSSAYSSLADDTAGMLKGYGSVLKEGATEGIIAKLQNAYAGSGLTAKQVNDYVDQYRKAQYND